MEYLTRDLLDNSPKFYLIFRGIDYKQSFKQIRHQSFQNQMKNQSNIENFL
jgi:hypothetical protein